MDKEKILKKIKYSLRFLPDKMYIQLYYFAQFKKFINFKNPKTFNEKLNWLKINDRNPKYTNMVDKYEAKKIAADIMGEEHIIPTLGVWDKFDDIDFEKLPNQFVLKCTHDSKGLVIVKDKQEFNKEEAKRSIEESLKYNFYYIGREWPYKNVKPRIIAEEYKEDKKYHELRDYKFYCFNGKCNYVMVCLDRFIDKTKFIYFDRDWNIKKEFSKDGIKYGDSIKVDRPKNLEKMFELAEKISKGLPFIRVDFYEVNGKLYFGEFTFYPTSGFDNKRTKECQEYLDNELLINNRK